MNTVTRTVVTLISGVATLHGVFWFGIPLIFLARFPFWISSLASVLVAAGVAWFVWTLTASFQASLARSVLLGAIAGGSIGFLAGLFGPLLFAQSGSANVGAILWSLIGGPAGLILGAVGAVARWYARQGRVDTSNWPRTDVTQTAPPPDAR